MVAIKGFALDSNGDVLIENNEIQMVNGTELTLQTIKSVLGTKKGEWFGDWNEGVDYDSILGKKRYAAQNSAIGNQYIQEIKELKEANDAQEQALNQRLAKRLDGE